MTWGSDAQFSAPSTGQRRLPLLARPPVWAKDYPLWLAQYPNQYAPGMQPTLPRGWFRWTFWQYSEKGRVNGINANVDLNLFDGTLEELYKFAAAEIITEKTETSQNHLVVAGDSFETIANRYGVTVRELVSANPQLLKTGDQLTIPVAVAIPAEKEDKSLSTRRTHTVKTGDTLTSIAIKYGTTVAAIASFNNITNINNISLGQVLQIP